MNKPERIAYFISTYNLVNLCNLTEVWLSSRFCEISADLYVLWTHIMDSFMECYMTLSSQSLSSYKCVAIFLYSFLCIFVKQNTLLICFFKAWTKFCKNMTIYCFASLLSTML